MMPNGIVFGKTIIKFIPWLRLSTGNFRCFLCTYHIFQIIFISMARKKQKAPMKENKLYVLPSLNDEMRNFVKNFKIDMMEHIISSIRFAIENKMPIIEVFQFKDSPFVVTISEKEFETNLNFIHQFFKENEIFDLMGKVESLQKLIKSKTNETQKSETNDDS